MCLGVPRISVVIIMDPLMSWRWQPLVVLHLEVSVHNLADERGLRLRYGQVRKAKSENGVLVNRCADNTHTDSRPVSSGCGRVLAGGVIQR